MWTLSGGSFQYDPFGRRVGKTISGATASYLYDGANVVQEPAGGVPTANLLSGGVDEVFTRTDSAGARNFLFDALGGTLALADSTGTLQTQYTYEPFGNTAAGGLGSTNPFQYTSRENDGTGLYFYRARYYSPTVQRFVSEDPIGIASGSTDVYAYVGNAPVDFTDPSGMRRYDSSCKGWGFGYAGSTGGLIGVVFAGAAANASWGYGVFHDSCKGFFHGYSFGGFYGGGAVAYAGSRAASKPSSLPGADPFAAGVSVGVDPVGFFVTNAGSVKQLGGPFLQVTGTAGATYDVNVSLASGSNGVTIFSLTGGVGYGAGGSALTTSTSTTRGP